MIPIRARVVIQFGVLVDIEYLASEFGDVVYVLLEEVNDATEDEALAELGFKPGNVVYPIQWQSERQRRAFFATNGFGAGIPYRRTDDYINAWDIELRKTSDNRIDWIISNDDPKARYVGGSFAADDKYQQRFHIATGWPRSLTRVNYWQNEFIERADARFGRYIDETFGQFSFHKRSR